MLPLGGMSINCSANKDIFSLTLALLWSVNYPQNQHCISNFHCVREIRDFKKHVQDEFDGHLLNVKIGISNLFQLL